MPSAVMAAAVILSLSSAADVTVAAVMLNAGRTLQVQSLTDGESLGQWLSRLTDAAREVRSRVNGQHSDVKCTMAALASAADGPLAACEVRLAAPQHFAGPPQPPVRAYLTDLPPPRG